MGIEKKDIQKSIAKVKNKEGRILYLLPDFERGSGGIIFAYQFIKALCDNGYDAYIVHQKEGFTVPYMGKFAKGVPILYTGEPKEGEPVTFPTTIEDFILIPEGIKEWMVSFQQSPAKKIVSCFNWRYVLDSLQPGETWPHLGIKDVISISDAQTKYLKLIMPSLNIKYACGYIDKELFYSPKHTDKEPTIFFIPTRDPQKTMNVLKTFYLLHPHLRWCKFVAPQNETNEKYAEMMRTSAFYLHADDSNSLATAPIEAYLCDTLVAGWDGAHGSKDYMTPENTFMVPNGDVVSLAMALGNMISAWLDCKIPQEMYDNMHKAAAKYTKEHTEQTITKAFDEFTEERIIELTNIMNRLGE